MVLIGRCYCFSIIFHLITWCITIDFLNHHSLHVWSKQKSQPNWIHIFIALLVACQERNTGEQQTNALFIKKTLNEANTTWKNIHNTYRHHKQPLKWFQCMRDIEHTRKDGACILRFSVKILVTITYAVSFFLSIGDNLIG